MGQDSAIAWTNHTFNPWEGCVHVSDGCRYCYAEKLVDTRFGRAKWGALGTRRLTSEPNWTKPIAWNAAAEKREARDRVFCASLADVFEDHPAVATSRMRLWRLIESTRSLDWLLLTKRPEHILAMRPEGGFPENVWLGTSVEDNRVSHRASSLAQVPIGCRFLSIEPMIGPVDEVDLTGINWVIVGGESAPARQAREMQTQWVEDIYARCIAKGVAFFFKQTGTNLAAKLRIGGKGDDIPPHLCAAFPMFGVREFPLVAALA